MHLHRRIKIQLALFAVIALFAITVMVFSFMKLPGQWFGVGRYTVTVQLTQAAGLYNTGNVTYRGTEVGRVQRVVLTDDGVDAILSMNSGIDIPSNLEAQVHSQSAIGEQYIALLPRDATSRPLRDGDVITVANTSVPPDINALLAAANTGLQAVPRDNLETLINESYTAVGTRSGTVPHRSRFDRIVHRCARQSGSAVGARRHRAAGLGFPDQHRRRDREVGNAHRSGHRLAEGT